MKVDQLSWKILDTVQRDGRISLKALASEVGLSLPAVSERLKRLEEAGIIEGYKACLNQQALGFGIMAVLGMTTPQPDKKQLISALEKMPEVLECLHVTGQDSYLIRVVAKDIADLERFIGEINHFGETTTSIVMSQPVPMRAISQPE